MQRLPQGESSVPTKWELPRAAVASEAPQSSEPCTSRQTGHVTAEPKEGSGFRAATG